MDVFITWSGEPSRLLAESLRKLLTRTIQAVRPFLSSEDIRKGARWSDEIGARLDTARFAIVCLTPNNLEARWIHFEAGAISRKGKETVSCLLLDVEETAVPYPLAQFQNTLPTKGQMQKLLGDINDLLEESRIAPDVLTETFDRFWPDFIEGVECARKALAQGNGKPKQKVDQAELLQQVLAEGRANSVALAALTQIVEQVGARVQMQVAKSRADLSLARTVRYSQSLAHAQARREARIAARRAARQAAAEPKLVVPVDRNNVDPPTG